jgi:diacylglycerol kinase family enzyme
MKLLVLLNEQAGTLAGLDPLAAQDRIARGFADNGADAEVRRVDPARLVDHAREGMSTGVDAIVAGGGDGTINSIANAVMNSRKGFGVLPLGTHNHFARDLNVPTDLDAAVAALAHGRIVEIPVAEVNGHAFLNFSAIGIHPEVVNERERIREGSDQSKSSAMLVALWRVLKKLPIHNVHLSSRGHTFARRTPSIIVCNNPYQMRAFGVAAASVPERGLLNVYVANHATRGNVVWLMLQALVGRLERSRNFTAMALPEIRVDTWQRRIEVSIDGEVITMRPPLYYSIRPQPLRVLMPARA